MKEYKCIMTVTKKSLGADVVEATKRAGARGGTIIYGRGSGALESKSFLGQFLEPEKALVITVLEKSQLQTVKKAIEESLALHEVGNGILFVLNCEDVIGITEIKDV